MCVLSELLYKCKTVEFNFIVLEWVKLRHFYRMQLKMKLKVDEVFKKKSFVTLPSLDYYLSFFFNVASSMISN